MGIPDVVFTIVVSIGVSIFVAFVVASARCFSSSRRIRRVELRLGDIEDRQASVQARKAAKTRWEGAEWEQELQKQVKDIPRANRYANDPLVSE